MSIASVIRNAVASPETLPQLAALAIDDLRGLDFLRNVEPETVGLDPTAAYHYAPSAKTWLRPLLGQLDLSDADCIIDVGCGKGAAMRIMLEFPFGRVEGIELSSQMAAIARHNFEILGVPDRRVRVHCRDASLFDGYDAFNYVYLFNPFPMPVFVHFFARLAESLARRPRRMTLMYNNPTCRAHLEASGLFRKKAEIIADWHNPLCVYVSV